MLVIKVGTSTLTHKSGSLNTEIIDKICKTISKLKNLGFKIILVSSGAIGVGMGKMGLISRPESTKEKQALAAIGQCELMHIYSENFHKYNKVAAQVLLTADVVLNEVSKQNVINTFTVLMDMGVVPIVNENDTVSVNELHGLNFGDNDNLSAIVATLINANKLIILTDIDGLYDKDPRKNKDARKISVVTTASKDIYKFAKESGSNRGTGGMITKVKAAKLCMDSLIECHIINGQDPQAIFKLLDGDENIGTVFKGN